MSATMTKPDGGQARAFVEMAERLAHALAEAVEAFTSSNDDFESARGRDGATT